MNTSIKLLTSITSLAMICTVVSPAAATSVPYTTKTKVFTNLGGSTPSDTLTLGSASGVFTGAGTFVLNHVSFFAAGFTVSPTPFTGFFKDSAVASGGSSPYFVAYSLQLGSSDTITLGANSFDLSGYHITIDPLVLTSGVGQTSIGTLYGTFTPIGSVPESSTWALMVAGFGMIGFAARSRRQNDCVS